MEEHDYKDTIDEINNAEDNAKAEEERAKRLDAEIAYEALAVSSSMGMFGMDQEVSELMQLQLSQEVLYKEQAEYNGEENKQPEENEDD